MSGEVLDDDSLIHRKWCPLIESYMKLPKKLIEQIELKEGAQVEMHLSQSALPVSTHTKPKYKIEDLMAEMPEGMPIDEKWENMPSVGLETQ